MLTERVNEIEALANFIAESYFGQNKVEPLEIARQNKITFSLADYQDYFDGLLEYANHCFHIFINTHHSESQHDPRVRFTIAHELGHFFIEEHRKALINGALPHPSFTEFKINNDIELEADLFAASLLMPKKQFLKKQKKCAEGVKGIVELAKYFSTSITSTAIRYLENNEKPTVLIFWKNNERKWYRISDNFNRIKEKPPYKLADKLPNDTLTSMALRGELDFETAIDQKIGSLLSIWFPSKKYSTNLSDIIHEQVLPLGQHGVITLLQSD